MTTWAEKKVGDLIDGLAAGVSVRSRDGDKSRPAVLKTSAVANGRVDFRETKAIVAADVSRAKCPPVRDSIVISRMNTPALVGAVGYVETAESGVFLPDRLWLARSKRAASTDMRWLNYALGFGDVATSVRELATGTSNSMKNIPKSRLLKLSLLVPSPEEQREISTRLVDVDGLIASLEQLIAKKRAIKQGMMQELLTGRIRLPGFSGQWRSMTFGDVVRIQRGSTLTRAQAGKGRIPVIAGGKIPAGYTDRPNRTGRTITISASGASAGYVAIYSGEIFASDCSTISRSKTFDLDFIYYSLLLRQDAIYRAQTGGAQPHIHARDIYPIGVQMPMSIDEQNAISRVLRDVDDEIATLERRLEAARAIKRGMMQELLTGRTRFAEEVAA